MTLTPATDYLIPFLREQAGARGRIVRLTNVADTILSRYDYPQPVAVMLGELLLVASMLGANLKQDGIFTIQLRGDGPVPLVVVDAAYGGQLRGFADVKPDADLSGSHYRPADLIGSDGYLAITLDPGEGMQRYQGVVALEGQSVSDAFINYFTHSQQLDVLFALNVEKRAGKWIAGGFMLERMPGEGGISKVPTEEQEENWRESKALAATIKPAELIDPLLEAETLLYQLFHESGVIAYPPQPLSAGCRCSRERILNMLTGMSTTDRADMVVDGEVTVHCQFCNTTERFTPEQIGLPPAQ